MWGLKHHPGIRDRHTISDVKQGQYNNLARALEGRHIRMYQCAVYIRSLLRSTIPVHVTRDPFPWLELKAVAATRDTYSDGDSSMPHLPLQLKVRFR